MLRFLQAGDFHLDSPFAALHPEQAVKARGEQRTLLGRLQQLATEQRVDLVLLCGDLFDARRVYPETLEAMRQTLAAIEAPIFIAPGNHDPYTTQSPYARFSWPKQVHIFKEAAVEAVPLPQLGLTVYGSAFTAALREDAPLRGLTVQGDGLHIGCFHADLAGTSRYGPLTERDIADTGLSYLALGHIHARSACARAGKTHYAYAGCLQGRGFDETGEKGAYLGSLDANGSVTLDFCPLALRRYESLTLDLNGRPAEAALTALLPPSPTNDIVRIVLRGERAEESLFLPALLHLAEPYFYSLSLTDESSLPQDLWARAQEESLPGLFLRELRARLAEADEADRPLIEAAARFGLAALEGREAPT